MSLEEIFLHLTTSDEGTIEDEGQADPSLDGGDELAQDDGGAGTDEEPKA